MKQGTRLRTTSVLSIRAPARDDCWRREFNNTDYYRDKYTWEDYAPAYGLGYHAKGGYVDRSFDEVENDLERAWETTKGKSRLAWNEARDAVRDGWHYVERAMPGDFDGDGR